MKISVTYLMPVTEEIEVEEKFRTLVDYDKKWFETYCLTPDEEREEDILLNSLFRTISDTLKGCPYSDEIQSLSDENGYEFWD